MTQRELFSGLFHLGLAFASSSSCSHTLGYFRLHPECSYLAKEGKTERGLTKRYLSGRTWLKTNVKNRIKDKVRGMQSIPSVVFNGAWDSLEVGASPAAPATFSSPRFSSATCIQSLSAETISGMHANWRREDTCSEYEGICLMTIVNILHMATWERETA